MLVFVRGPEARSGAGPKASPLSSSDPGPPAQLQPEVAARTTAVGSGVRVAALLAAVADRAPGDEDHRRLQPLDGRLHARVVVIAHDVLLGAPAPKELRRQRGVRRSLLRQDRVSSYMSACATPSGWDNHSLS